MVEYGDIKLFTTWFYLLYDNLNQILLRESVVPADSHCNVFTLPAFSDSRPQGPHSSGGHY